MKKREKEQVLKPKYFEKKAPFQTFNYFFRYSFLRLSRCCSPPPPPLSKAFPPTVSNCSYHGLINYIDTKAKCHHLNKNLPVKGLCVRFLSVWGPIHSYDPIPPLTYCIWVYCKLNHTGKGGGGKRWTREKVRGATIHKAGSKIPTLLTVSPVYIQYSHKHLPQSPFSGQFFYMTTFSFGFYIVN